MVSGVLVVGLLAVWVRGNATDIRQAERLARALTVGAGAARLVHEVQRERDLSAYYVASGRRLDYGTMLAQRVWANQASRAYEQQVGRFEPHLADYDQSLATSLDEAGRRLAALTRFRRERIDEPKQKLGTAETLRGFGTTVDALLGIVAEVSRVGDGSALSQDLQATVALGRYKEAVAQERSYLYAAYAAGGFAPGRADPASPAGVARTEVAPGGDARSLPYRGFTSILEGKASWRSRLDALADGEWDARLSRALTADADVARDVGHAEEFAKQVRADPSLIRQADHRVVKTWFFAMNSQVDALRRLENQFFSDVTRRAASAGEGAALW